MTVEAPATPRRPRRAPYRPGARPRATFLVMACSFLACLAAVSIGGLATTGGHFTYALDDAYIHLAMARTLVQHGVYGPTPYGFESASSSPLWTLLLAAMSAPFIAVLPALPFLMATLGGLAVLRLFASGQGYVQALPGRPGLLVATILLPILLFLPGLVIGGMEATIFMAVALAIVTLFIRQFAPSAGGVAVRSLPPRQLGSLLALSALAPLLRFEALFLCLACLAAALAAVAVLRGDDAPGMSMSPLRPVAVAAGMCVFAAAGTALYAGFNVANGQYPLPNSVMAKSGAGGSLLLLLRNLPAKFQNNFLDDGLVAPLFLFGLYLVVHLARRRSHLLPLAVVFTVVSLLHLALADTGSFLRYQSYLVALGLLLVLRFAVELRDRANQAGRWQMIGGVILIAAFGFGLPRFYLTAMAPTAMANIYQQQGQVAAFYADQYAGQTVGDDDIGMVSWLHQGPLFDLRALGTFEVLQAMKRGDYNSRFIEGAATRNGVQVVALHERVVGPLVPASWVKVAEITEPSANIVMISSTAVLYAPDEGRATVLREKLRAYEPRFAPGVTLKLEPPG